MTRYRPTQKTRYSKSPNKPIIAISLTLCLVTGLALLSLPAIFSTNHLKQIAQEAKLMPPDASNPVLAKLSLQLEQIRLYFEQSLKDLHSGWIAGSAKSLS